MRSPWRWQKGAARMRSRVYRQLSSGVSLARGMITARTATGSSPSTPPTRASGEWTVIRALESKRPDRRHHRVGVVLPDRRVGVDEHLDLVSVRVEGVDALGGGVVGHADDPDARLHQLSLG